MESGPPKLNRTPTRPGEKLPGQPLLVVNVDELEDELDDDREVVNVDELEDELDDDREEVR